MKNDQKEYIAEPFSNMFNGFQKLFGTSQSWVITIISMSFLGAFINFLFRLVGNLSTIAEEGSRPAAALGNFAQTSNNDFTPFIIIVSLIFTIAFIAIYITYNIVATGIYSLLTLETIKNKKFGFVEGFKKVLPQFWQIWGLNILIALMGLGGFILFIIPGIIISLRLSMANTVLIDEKKGIMHAISRSFELTKGRAFELFCLGLSIAIIPFSGLVRPLLGAGAFVAMYPDMVWRNANNIDKPKLHWSNYISLGIFVFVLMLITLGVVILGLAALASAGAGS